MIVTTGTNVSTFDFEQLKKNNLPSFVEYSTKDFIITVNSVAGTQGTYNMYLVATISSTD